MKFIKCRSESDKQKGLCGYRMVVRALVPHPGDRTHDWEMLLVTAQHHQRPQTTNHQLRKRSEFNILSVFSPECVSLLYHHNVEKA